MLHLEALQLIIAYLLFRDYPLFADMLPVLPYTVRRALAAFNAYFSCEDRQEHCAAPEACGSCGRENAGSDAALSALCELLGSAESSSTASQQKQKAHGVFPVSRRAFSSVIFLKNSHCRYCGKPTSALSAEILSQCYYSVCKARGYIGGE